MDTPREPDRHNSTTTARFIGQLLWTLLWLFVAFAMLVAGLCGLNFIAVGLLAIFLDCGEWGPRFDGELAQTPGQMLVFTGVGALLANASAAFYWLNARRRDGAAVGLFVVVVVAFLVLSWATGVHNLSGGFGSIGINGR